MLQVVDAEGLLEAGHALDHALESLLAELPALRVGAVSSLWGRTCKSRFAVAGRRRERRETPAVELIACPACQEIRRMVLPVNVGAPFRIVGPADRTREG